MNLQKFSNDFPSLIYLVRNNSYPVHSDFTTFLSRLNRLINFHLLCVKINIRHLRLDLSIQELVRRVHALCVR